MDAPGLTIYNFPVQPANLDAIGTGYLILLVGWTLLVSAGALYLVLNRRHPIVRVRGLGLSLGGIAMLHAYWCLAQVVCKPLVPLIRHVPGTLVLWLARPGRRRNGLYDEPLSRDITNAELPRSPWNDHELDDGI